MKAPAPTMELCKSGLANRESLALVFSWSSLGSHQPASSSQTSVVRMVLAHHLLTSTCLPISIAGYPVMCTAVTSVGTRKLKVEAYYGWGWGSQKRSGRGGREGSQQHRNASDRISSFSSYLIPFLSIYTNKMFYVDPRKAIGGDWTTY